jgi:hypothetical protein
MTNEDTLRGGRPDARLLTIDQVASCCGSAAGALPLGLGERSPFGAHRTVSPCSPGSTRCPTLPS